jgi:putative ABC transport system substrate-binding protein
LEQGLERAGLVDGRTARLEYRYAAGGLARFAPLAKEMVALKPDVIFVQSTGFAAAVHRETRTIPVVFANVSDPLGAGFVESLARPGGNFTGLLLFEGGIAAKWLAMLKEIAPGLKRAAMIVDPNVTPVDYFFRPADAVAAALGVEVKPSAVRNVVEIEGVLNELAARPDTGFLVAPGSTMLRNRDRIIALAVRNRLPAVFPERVYAADGGLMSYGIADLIEPFRQAGSYIDRMLRGEGAGELPVQGPTKYTTVVNLKTAKALGLTVPPGLLVAADEVIE